MSNDLQRFSDKIGDIITEQTNSEKSTFQQILIESDNYAIAFYEWRSTSLIKNINQYKNQETIDFFKKEYLIRNEL